MEQLKNMQIKYFKSICRIKKSNRSNKLGLPMCIPTMEDIYLPRLIEVIKNDPFSRDGLYIMKS